MIAMIHRGQKLLHDIIKEALIKSSPRRRGSGNLLNILDSRFHGNDKYILNQDFPKYDPLE